MRETADEPGSLPQDLRLSANSRTCALAALAPARIVPPTSPAPGLAAFDLILVNISGGKDSQAALDATYRAAVAQGVTDRLVTVFCDLGEQDEWPGTRQLAAEHAAHYGIRHETVFRTVTAPDGSEVQHTLSEHIEARGMWPDQARRYAPPTSSVRRFTSC